MLIPMDESHQPWHFETTLNRRSLRWQAAAGFSAGVVLFALAGQSLRAGSAVGTVMGIAGAGLFWMLARLAWNQTRMSRAPLILDLHGLSVNDGTGDSWTVAWDKIDSIELRRGFWGRKIVVILSGPEGEERELPPLCYGDAPPEWTAGLIETFRRKGLHQIS